MIKVFVTQLPDPDITESGVRYELVNPGDLRTAGADKLSGWFRYSHEGLVLWTGEHNHYDDSDFFAVVWDEAAGVPREIEYATTRGWTYANSATVDATPAVQEAYAEYRRERAEAQREAQAAAEAATPRVGTTVRVVRGRKIPVGTVAEVTWFGEGKVYGYGARYGLEPPMRVGLMIDGERVYTAASNVEVIAPATPAALPLLRTEFYVLASACPVCGEHTDSHEWWDTRGGIPENCSQATSDR
jgi:hypothetical protein